MTARELAIYERGGVTALAAEADRQLAAKSAKRARVRARPGVREEAEKKLATRDGRMERLAAIRVALHAETGGTCVVCEFGLPFARMHAHHVLGGPERQAEERQETMAPVHEKCHDWLHGKDGKLDQLDALVKLLGWCVRTGREEAAESTQRRIEKIHEARGVAIRLVVREEA